MNEMISQSGNLYTGAVADTLDELSYHDQCLPPDIRPLADSMKVAGPVYTVLGKRRHYDDGVDPRYRQMDMLDAIPSGDLPPMNWSTGIVSKRRIKLWESSVIRRKRLLPSCARLRYWLAREWPGSMRSGRYE